MTTSPRTISGRLFAGRNLPLMPAADWALFLAVLVPFGFFSAVLFEFTSDDAFITFRYSRHLLETGTPLWNVGSSPAEGYTSFLHVLLMALPLKVGLDPVLTSKWLGIFAEAGAALLIYVLALHRYGRMTAFCAALLVAATPLASLHAVAGMETGLFTGLMVLLAAAAWRVAESPGDWRAQVLLGAVALLAGLARPEGALAGAVVVGVLWAVSPGTRSRQYVVAIAAAFVLPGLAYFIWRWSYFGQFFPNTYYVKAGGLFARDALLYVRGFVLFALPVGVVSVASLFRGDRIDRARTLLPLAAAAAVGVPCLLTKPMMGYEYRFLVPAFPLLVLAASPLLARIVRTAGRSSLPLRAAAVAALAVLFAVPQVRETANAWSLRGGGGSSYLPEKNFYVPLGRGLRAAADEADMPPEWLVVSHYNAGALAYYSDWTFVDVIGLNERRIAREGFHPDRVYEYDPDVLLLSTEDPRTVTRRHLEGLDYHDYRVAEDPRLGEYELAAIYGSGPQWLRAYVRTASPAYDAIIRALRTDANATAP